MRTPITIPDKLTRYFHGIEVEAFVEGECWWVQSKDLKYSVMQTGALDDPYVLERCCEFFESDVFQNSLPGLRQRLKDVDDDHFKSTLYAIETEWGRPCMEPHWHNWVNREIQLRLLTKRFQ